VRWSSVDKRATRYAARQFVSDYETEPEGAAKMTSDGERSEGTVKFFNGEKGFGFIKPNGGGPDVFLHAKALKRSGIEGTVTTGDKVAYDAIVADGKPGPKAENIKLLQVR